jgi:hypothetical protein
MAKNAKFSFALLIINILLKRFIGWEDQVKLQFNAHPRIFLHIGKAIFLFLIGAIGIHTIIMLINHFLISVPFSLNLHTNFVKNIFSLPMFPMMATYGLLLLVLYFFWIKQKEALLLAHQKEIETEKTELVLKSMQQLTGILAQHIATHNSQIIDWIESKKLQGKQVSEKVENPTRKIAGTLHSLSEISFVFPYTENRPINIEAIEKVLRRKLDEMIEPVEKIN